MAKDIKKIKAAYLAISSLNQLKDYILVDIDDSAGSNVLKMISWKSEDIDLSIEDKVRFALSEKGIDITKIETRKVSRAEYVKTALELSDALDVSIDSSIGDPSNTREYIEALLEVGEDMRSSDVYVCPDTGDNAGKALVQMKVDGRLRVVDRRITIEDLTKISSELKKRLSHDSKKKVHALEGSFYNDSNPDSQYRISIMQTNSGSATTTNPQRLDSIVIRILKTRDIGFNLEELGYLREDVEKVRRLTDEKSGVILVTGKTSTGKSTTLGSMLTEIYKKTNGEEKIVTFEDPVEYRIDGTIQFQVIAREEADDDSSERMSYYTALKNCLRQAPDVIMLGEVRDAMTARLLFDTAQTGHLLLSSMHSKTVISALTRLAYFGVDGSVINDSLLGILSQTLIRRNCSKCMVTRTMTEDEMRYFLQPTNDPDGEYEKFTKSGVRFEVAESTGVVNGGICQMCDGTKFYGRVPLVEIYIHDNDDEKHVQVIADICNKDPLGRIKIKDMFKQGLHEPLALNALKHIFYRTTSPQEVMRHLPPSMFRDYKSLLIRKTNEIVEAQGK